MIKLPIKLKLIMRRVLPLTLALAMSGTLSATPLAGDPAALALLKAGIDAQGGESRLRALQAVRIETVGYRNLLEQSERPEGPYIPEFRTTTETRDQSGRRFREVLASSVYIIADGSSAGGRSVQVVADGVAMRQVAEASSPGDGLQVRLAAERLALSPERLLITAMEAANASLRGKLEMQRIAQDVVEFTYDGAPVRLYLNPYTHLPTAYDYSGPLARSGYRAYTGDATQRTFFSLWKLTDRGLRMPLQVDVFSNGLPDRTFMVSKLEFDPTLAPDDFAIPQAVKAQFRPGSNSADIDKIPLGLASDPAKEIAPGVIFIPGRWNVTLVRQDDGVVVIEAPISSGYSAEVLAEAARRFPRLPVKAVISTSDAWPHLAGVREYAARGIPIYTLDLNRSAVMRIIDTPHTASPDRLQRAPRAPMLKSVGGKVAIGSGANRLELYPVRGETSERQMMAFFPGLKLLYGSDVFQERGSSEHATRSFAFPQQVSELVEAVKRNHLDVERLFMMHIDPIPWADVAAAPS
jgi:hypothetical protein